MINVFLDTSTLVKLYHYEEDSDKIEGFFATNEVRKIYLSSLSSIEFLSALYKKVRTRELKMEETKMVESLFITDANNFHFVKIHEDIISSSQKLVSSYGEEGLRTLDAIQLSSALSVKNRITHVLTHDKLFRKIGKKEGLVMYP